MTKADTDRLVTQLELAKKDIAYMKNDIKDMKIVLERLEKKIDDQNDKINDQGGKYITQTFAMWLAGFLVTIVIAGVAIANWISKK